MGRGNAPGTTLRRGENGPSIRTGKRVSSKDLIRDNLPPIRSPLCVSLQITDGLHFKAFPGTSLPIGPGGQLQCLSMKCPGCSTEMTAMTLDGRLGGQVAIDVCARCQAFWFDHFESLKLSPGSTLKLMKFIGEHSTPGKPSLPETLRCPRCATMLRLAHDLQGNMPFTYWRCATDDGHFINFLEFLKEKNFIHRLSPGQIQELRQNVQFVNCSNCGASINLESDSACPYCHSPISMLDMKQPQRMLDQLKQAADSKPLDPMLPMKLASAKLQLETSLADHDRGPEWWSDASSSGLVWAGLNVVARWLSDKLID